MIMLTARWFCGGCFSPFMDRVSLPIPAYCAFLTAAFLGDDETFRNALQWKRSDMNRAFSISSIAFLFLILFLFLPWAQETVCDQSTSKNAWAQFSVLYYNE